MLLRDENGPQPAAASAERYFLNWQEASFQFGALSSCTSLLPRSHPVHGGLQGACKTANHHATAWRKRSPTGSGQCLTMPNVTFCTDKKLASNLPVLGSCTSLLPRSQPVHGGLQGACKTANHHATAWRKRSPTGSGQCLTMPNVTFCTDKKLASNLPVLGSCTSLLPRSQPVHGGLQGSCKTANHHATAWRKLSPTGSGQCVTLRANTLYRPHPFYAVHLGISNARLYIELGRSTRVFREYKFPTPLNFYIHWRSSIRVQFSHPR